MIQLEHNILKNSNRPEANQLASFFKAYVAKKANSGATVKQIQVVVRVHGDQTRDRWIASPKCWSIQQAASCHTYTSKIYAYYF